MNQSNSKKTILDSDDLIENYNCVSIQLVHRKILGRLYSTEYLQKKTKLLYGITIPHTFTYEDYWNTFSTDEYAVYLEESGFYNNDNHFIITYSVLYDLVETLSELGSAVKTHEHYEDFMNFFRLAMTCSESERTIMEYNTSKLSNL